MNVKGKCKLYQYDINQSLENVSGKYVDFPTIADTYRVAVVDGVVRIPDEFLQSSGEKKVFVVNADETLCEHMIKIISRPMPPNYIYTPTEHETFEELVERVNTLDQELEQLGGRVNALDQEKLSAEDLKTINGESIVGSGDMVITGGNVDEAALINMLEAVYG